MKRRPIHLAKFRGTFWFASYRHFNWHFTEKEQKESFWVNDHTFETSVGDCLTFKMCIQGKDKKKHSTWQISCVWEAFFDENWLNFFLFLQLIFCRKAIFDSEWIKYLLFSNWKYSSDEWILVLERYDLNKKCILNNFREGKWFKFVVFTWKSMAAI